MYTIEGKRIVGIDVVIKKVGRGRLDVCNIMLKTML